MVLSSGNANSYPTIDTATERALAAIWSEVLGSTPIRGGDAFLDLGGDSLSAIHCISRIRREFGIDLFIDDLCARGSTLASLASRIDQGVWTGSAPTPGVGQPLLGDEIPVTINQEKRLMKEEQRELSGSPLSPFNLVSVLRLEGHLDVTLLERALNEIVTRHDMLRASFVPADGISEHERHNRERIFLDTGRFVPGMFRYHVEPPQELTLTIDHSRSAEHSDELRRIIRIAARTKITGIPKLKATLVPLSDTLNILILVVPHLAADAKSMQIIKNHLQLFYVSLRTGQDRTLPTPSHRFAEFVSFQHEYLASQYAQPAISYWKEQWRLFDSARIRSADLRKLPGAPQNESPVNRYVSLSLGDEDVQRLRRFASDSGVTLFMLLSVTFCLALNAGSGKKMIAVWVNFANRIQAEFQEVVGWFVNSHLLGFDLRDDETMLAILNRTRTSVSNATNYQGLPLAHLWRILGEAPVPDEVFVLFDFQLVEDREEGSPVMVSELPLASYLTPRIRPNTLEIRVADRGATIDCGLLFNGSGLSPDSMSWLLREWYRIVIASPRAPMSRISEFVGHPIDS